MRAAERGEVGVQRVGGSTARTEKSGGAIENTPRARGDNGWCEKLPASRSCTAQWHGAAGWRAGAAERGKRGQWGKGRAQGGGAGGTRLWPPHPSLHPTRSRRKHPAGARDGSEGGAKPHASGQRRARVQRFHFLSKPQPSPSWSLPPPAPATAVKVVDSPSSCSRTGGERPFSAIIPPSIGFGKLYL